MAETLSPNFLRRIQQLKIRTRRSFLGSRQGSHLSLRRGHGLEFAEYRPYAPGDDFRHIDWGVLGRSDRLYVRQFREEQDLQVSVLLDSSASMAFPEDEGKLELSRDVALTLAFIALADGDSVVLSLLGQGNSPRYRGVRAFPKAVRYVRGTQAKGSFSLLQEVRAAIAQQKTPGRAFFVSDFLYPTEEVVEALDHLRSRNFETALVHLLSPSEEELPSENTRFVDSESGAELELALDADTRRQYARELSRHRATLEHYAAQAGMQYVLIPTKETLQEAVFRYLARSGMVK